MATLEQLGSEKYVLLTTFRRDGRAVPTPLWVVPDGAGLAFWTPNGTGKLKRIRNSGRVTVAACDMRGNATGEPIEARARIGDAADRRRVGEGLKRKYGLLARLTLLGSRLRRGVDGTVAVLVSAEPAA
ncbi:PPOX class F420-dependent oxidoreductase [Actinoplanes sp. NPDC049668]|uniref:PPOX class F420-dependent oxidoreductase n=1 Tax=unclassified Actinoplanes TaxID=2626549 RepID=UPI00339ED4A0